MEAHATDEWPIGNLPAGTELKQHTSLEGRIAAAKMFQATQKLHSAMKLFIDPMDNSFNQTYQSWPTRAWVISANERKIVYKSMPGDGSGSRQCVNLEELSRVLDDCVLRSTASSITDADTTAPTVHSNTSTTTSRTTATTTGNMGYVEAN